MLNKYFIFIKRIYEKEDSALALALFRIIYSSIVFAEVWQIFYFRHLIFDPIPYVSESVYSVTPALIIWMISLFLIAIGLFTKLSVFINYLMSILFLGFSFGTNSGSMHEYHIDTELLTVGLVLIFMPISKRLSIDALINKLKYSTIGFEYKVEDKISSINYVILTLTAGLIYFDSIFYKANSPMWLEGLGIWLPASLPWAGWLDLSFILNQEYLIKCFGYLTLLFQLTYIFLVWFKRFKVIFLLIGIGLHIGIFFAFPIPWFALSMVALYIGIIPSSFYSRLYRKIFKSKNKPTLTFYFDENCPLCNRLRIIIQYFDNSRNILFLSIQKDANNNELFKNISTQQLLDNVYSVDNKNKIYTGIDTYIRVLNKVWIFKPIGFLLYIPFVKSVGVKIYGYVAKHRITYGCTKDTCSTGLYTSNYIERDDSKLKILQNLDLKTVKVFFIAFFIAFFVVSQLIIMQNAPLIQKIYDKIGLPNEVKKELINLSSTIQSILYPITGFEGHGVFLDYHFKDYTSIYNIYYIDKNNNEVILPIMRENGLVDWMNTGRQWRYWTFSTIAASGGNPLNMQSNLKKFIYFWAYKNNVDIKNSKFILKRKEIKVSNQWEKDLLKNNLESPWKEIGILYFIEGVSFTNNIPKIDEIDFSIEKLPLFIKSSSGFSEYEQSFRWSDGEKSEIFFYSKLPKKFKLTISGTALINSFDNNMKIIIGNEEKKINLKYGYNEYILDFENINSRDIIFEYPKIPVKFDPSNKDIRKLTFAFYKIKFEENK